MINMPYLLSVREVADALKISAESVRTLIREGELPAVHIGPRQKILRVHATDLRTYIEAHYNGSQRWGQ